MLRVWSESLRNEDEERRERQREEEREYIADVEYVVWRSGGRPDNVDRDRVAEHREQGWSEDASARLELQKQRPQPREPEQEEYPQEESPQES